MENHALPPYVVGFAAGENNVQIARLSVHHTQECPCQNMSKLLSPACWLNEVCQAYSDIVMLQNAKDVHETY